MKQKIIEALTAKFNGVSASILNRIADKLTKTVTSEEDVATAVEGVTFQQVLESYGDSRATEAQQSAVSNYEKKHGLKDGQKTQKEVTGGLPNKEPELEENNDKDTPAWAKALIESNKKLSDRLNAMEGEKVVTSRKQKLEAIIKELPKLQQNSYRRISLDNLSDEDFETMQTEIQTEVQALLKESKAKGAVFGLPKGNNDSQSDEGGKKATKEEADAITKTMNI
jgi:hypothetical protein